jgi:hypothetical protein
MQFISTLSNDMGEGWKGMTCKDNRKTDISVESRFLSLGLDDMDSNTCDAVYVHL